MLNDKQGGLLLKLAKEAIKGEIKIPNKPFLKEKRGVFVTIRLKGELRGCIGLPYPHTSLGKAVVEAAKSAAYKDPRFPPLKSNESNNLEVEVSVLTKPEKCDLKDIKKGDGVILKYLNHNALFLPQVWNTLKTKKKFMEQLSMKAFLPPDAYKKANFQKFQVQVFK